jgi:hypothetical protein
VGLRAYLPVALSGDDDVFPLVLMFSLPLGWTGSAD